MDVLPHTLDIPLPQVTDMPLQRRQSSAHPTTHKLQHNPRRKRALSLLSNNTRHLVPRKSILKSAFNFNAQSQPRQEIANAAEADGTDLAEDNEYHSELYDDSHKSISRRVSFAPSVTIRLFEGNEQNTNSSGGPSSSPVSSPEAGPSSSVPPQLSNENDYPGRRISVGMSRRGSSVSEYGEASMSLDVEDDCSDPPTQSVFFPSMNFDRNTIQSPAPEFDEEESQASSDEDMEITEAIALNIHRKRSLSISQQKAIARSSMASRRSSIRPPTVLVSSDDDSGQDLSVEDSTTRSQESQESEGPMEFTAPLEKSLQPPRPPSDAWLALTAATHSQEEGRDDETEEMELTSALSRLRSARASFDFGQPSDYDNNGEQGQDDSVSTVNDSMGDVDYSEHTINVTSILGGVRNLEISEDKDGNAAPTDNNLPEQLVSITVLPEDSGRTSQSPAPSSAVFFRPSSSSVTSTPSTASGPEHMQKTQPPPSRLKPPSSSIFAPTISSSAKRVSLSAPTKDSVTVSSPSKKRPLPSSGGQGEDSNPSPAKKRATEIMITPLGQSQAENRQSNTNNANLTQTRTSNTGANNVGSRRPSGYFAQRRSLAPGTLNPSSTAQHIPNSKMHFAPQTSPKKSQLRRASIAVLPSIAKGVDENFAPDAVLQSLTKPKPTMATDVARKDDNEDALLFVNGEKNNPVSDLNELSAHPAEEQVQTESWTGDEIEDDIPPISMEEFFMMTGIRFMDELTVPRHSMIHNSQLSNNREEASPSMSDFVTAINEHIPQLQIYSLAAKDLQAWVDNNKKVHREIEDNVEKVMPGLFREFSSANEDERSALLHQLKLIKANKHSAAKEKWYNWKYQWTENLLATADQGYAELESDQAILDEIINQAQNLLPSLRQQHSQILLELEKERTEVDAIEQSDPVYLGELKAAIAEQNEMLDNFRAEIANGAEKLAKLNEKLAELESEKQENLDAIQKAERTITIRQHSTHAVVFRLQGTLESLQVLHSWRVVQVSEQKLEMIFDNEFIVTIPCEQHIPNAAKITISRSDNPPKRRLDLLPVFNNTIAQQAQQYVRGAMPRTAKSIVATLNDFWTSCAQIRTQLQLLSIKFPLSIESLQDKGSPGIKAVALVLLHRHKAKANVTFLFDETVMARWPSTIRELQCDVEITYGRIKAEEVRAVILERLSEATIDGNHACLLDACSEAVARYGLL